MCDRKVELWQRVELFFHLQRPANPYTDVQVVAEFTSPTGRPIGLHGFHAGEDVWKVRFAPDEIGTWQWRAHLPTGPAEGLLQCHGGAPTGLLLADAEFPQRLRFQSGKWCLGLGGEPRALAPAEASLPADESPVMQGWLSYLDALVRHGVNRMKLRLLPSEWTQSALIPWTVDPVTGTPDLAQFDLRFWNLLDRVLAAAAAREIVVDLVPFGGPYWAQTSSVHMTQRWQAQYVAYLAARTAAYWNVCYHLAEPDAAPGADADADASQSGNQWLAFLTEHDPYRHLASGPVAAIGREPAPPDAEPSTNRQADVIAAAVAAEPGAAARFLHAHWPLGRPMAADPVIAAAPDSAGEPASVQERRWFWTCFVGGGMPSLSGREPLEPGDGLPWVRHLVSFAQELEWWRMAPLPEAVAQATCEVYCCGSHAEMVAYCIGEGSGHKAVLRVDPGNYLVQWYDPQAGVFAGEAAAYSDNRLAIELPAFREDIVVLLRRVTPHPTVLAADNALSS